MRQRIQLSNAIRGHMAEFGIVAPIGRNGLERLLKVIRDEADERVPTAARGYSDIQELDHFMRNRRAAGAVRKCSINSSDFEYGSADVAKDDSADR